MNWKLPNQLTVGRIALSAVFFVLLGLYEQGAAGGQALLNTAFVLYIVAGITDILDGWIARKWNLTSAFGRIADPFVDKVLVVGAFAMLAGSNYAINERFVGEFERSLPGWLNGGMASGVQAWMVVVIMGREFIVSAVRGYSESQGQKFPATSAGKIKMFVQSVVICTVLYQLANFTQPAVEKTPVWTIVVKIAAVWLAVIVTVFSGVAYIGKTRRLLLSDGKD
ncbi:MAG: CDP-alcohol phosphatidyltransferase family protein [Planctomycetota bacterium]|nr:CDP-alcohol phosphatidyltransferase family protein [Planctomycetota bacterium]